MSNILITSAGKRVVLVQIFQKTLKELGLEAKVYTVDMLPEMAPACIISDGWQKVSRCTSDNYVEELLMICQQKDIGVIIPTIDTELLVLARAKSKFEEMGVEIVISDEEFIATCRDKRLTMPYLEQHGITVPKLIDKQHPKFPMFAKPFDGSLSSDTHVVRNINELNILDNPKLIFMEYYAPDEYREFSVDMYYGKDGLVKSIVPRERIAVRAGEINKGITRKNHIVEYLRQRMGSMSGVRGSICLQLFYRECDNDIIGIEVNPRFGGGYPLAYYANANFAEYIIREYMLHETIDYSDGWLENTLLLRYDNDVIVYGSKA